VFFDNGTAFNQRLRQINLLKKGNDVQVWSVWANGKPNGRNEVHPVWKVAQKYYLGIE